VLKLVTNEHIIKLNKLLNVGCNKFLFLFQIQKRSFTDIKVLDSYITT